MNPIFFELIAGVALFFVLVLENGIVGAVVRQPEGRSLHDSVLLALLSYVIFIPVSLALYVATIAAVYAVFDAGRSVGGGGWSGPGQITQIWAVATGAVVSLIANGFLKYYSLRHDARWSSRFGYSVLATLGIWAWQPLAIARFGLLTPLIFAIAATAASVWLIWKPRRQQSWPRKSP